MGILKLLPPQCTNYIHFPSNKILRLKIEALFQLVTLYTDIKKIEIKKYEKTHIIVKLILSRSATKLKFKKNIGYLFNL